MLYSIITKIFKKQQKDKVQKDKGEKTMFNYTEKESNLLLKTIIERELGINVVEDIKDLRSKVNIFENDNNVNIEKISEKQGTTRVSIFRVTYNDGQGTAYTHTL